MVCLARVKIDELLSVVDGILRLKLETPPPEHEKTDTRRRGTRVPQTVVNCFGWVEVECLQTPRGTVKDRTFLFGSTWSVSFHPSRGEVAQSSVLQQTMVVEFQIVNQQCETCQKSLGLDRRAFVFFTTQVSHTGRRQKITVPKHYV